ncbi:MAG: hypothetical protein KDD44_10215, partial [Bdellovibrionales bacterium]|nr:hypothetical protein [Bdellovibrionales bacterium]
FHLLRRQALRRWRKPLIVFTPKSMLRATQSSSPLSEFTAGHFRNVLDHSEAEPSAVQRILFCSGKIAHQLSQKRAQLEDSSSAVVSIEQLYPFPEDEVTKIFAKYSNATSVVWVQEECANMGALFFVKPLIQRLAGNRNVSTVKRSASASPATGSAKAHAIEQESLINLAFARFQ